MSYMFSRNSIIFSYGNCRNDADSHDEVRQTVMSYIESNADYFKLFMEDDESIDLYIRRMKSSYEWGGHQELYAASQCFGTNIVIHQLDCPDYIIQANNVKNSATTIHLSYHGECHYNSVIALDHANAIDHTNSIKIDKSDGTVENDDRKFHDREIDLVAHSVPWMNRDYVMSALSSSGGDVDAAIEWLCIHMNEHCDLVGQNVVENGVTDTLDRARDDSKVISYGMTVDNPDNHNEKDHSIIAIPCSTIIPSSHECKDESNRHHQIDQGTVTTNILSTVESPIISIDTNELALTSGGKHKAKAAISTPRPAATLSKKVPSYLLF